MQVLIADDEPISLHLLSRALSGWDYEVVTATDGEEAWRCLDGPDGPKIAILDWQMPGVDGLELCRRIRAKENGAYVYIIMLTSRDRTDDLMEGMDAGADDYITKPYEPHRLKVRLRAARRVVDLQTELMASLNRLECAQQREGEYGSRIQQTLLFGYPPTNMDGFAAAAITRPSQQIDGDFFDFFDHGGECLDVIVGDVMGKGVPAALFGAAVKSHFLHAINRLMAERRDQLPDPELIVSTVHTAVTAEFIGLESFVTLCYARFDMARRLVTFVDCGHTKTMQIRADGNVHMLEGMNMPLGVVESEVYVQSTASIEAGDLYFFYSDGVTEARNTSGEQFGLTRLAETLRAAMDLCPEAIVEAVRDAVLLHTSSYSISDDLTCVAVSITPQGESNRS